MNGLFNVLSEDSFLTINGHILRSFEVDTALILALFIDYQSEVDNQQKENEERVYFSLTQVTIEEKLYMSSHKQLKAIKLLEKLGILHTQIKGLPSKKYYYIDEDAVFHYLGQTVEQNRLAVINLKKGEE